MRAFAKFIIRNILELEAKLILRKYNPHIVAVTGSVGKTSTKDAIDAVLSTAFLVRSSQKSFNSEIGVPLTVLGRPNAWGSIIRWIKNLADGLLTILLRMPYPKWLVLEIGIDRPGDMLRATRWISPDVVVFTRFPDVPVHVEFFATPEEVIEEKKLLARALKEGGVLVLNNDDPKVRIVRSDTASRTILFGFEEGAEFRASNLSYLYEEGKVIGISFRVDHNGKSIPITLNGVVGKHFVYPALAALAVGASQNLNLISMGEALARERHAPGRMRLLDGLKGSQVIDDTYNSSPAAVHEALSTLKEVKVKGKKIVVLGDMLELGSYAQEAHRAVGEMAAEVADILIAVGIRARFIAEAAEHVGMDTSKVLEAGDSEEAGKMLRELLEEGDTVLLKGSQSMRMERAVEAILAKRGDTKFLVRQDSEWKKR